MFRPGNVIYACMLVAIAIILLSVLTVNYYTSVIIPFKSEKEYLKSEIRRSTGRARRHWQRKLKKHNMKLIPFVGKYLAKTVK